MSFLLVGGIVLVSCYTGYFGRACRVFSWHWSSGDWVWNSEAEATVSCYLFYFNYNMKRMLYFKNAWLDFIWFLPRLRRLMLTCKENSLWPRFWAYFYFLFNKLGFFILSIFGLILSHLIGIFFTIFCWVFLSWDWVTFWNFLLHGGCLPMGFLSSKRKGHISLPNPLSSDMFEVDGE